MKKLFNGILFSLFALALNAFAIASERGTADDAVAIVKKAAAYIKQNGKDKAFSDLNNPDNAQFHDRDLYVFVYDANGNNLVHGGNPKMVGKNLMDMKDVDGKLILKEIIEVANNKGNGWVDYKWPNPVTKNIELKSSYIEKVDGLIIGCGVYKG